MTCEINRKLVRLKLQESPVHEILPDSNLYDLRSLNFIWEGPELNRDLSVNLKHRKLIMELVYTMEQPSLPGKGLIKNTKLTFLGVRDIEICDESMTGFSVKIFDTSEYLPEMPGPIRVQGTVCFWAQEVYGEKGSSDLFHNLDED